MGKEQLPQNNSSNEEEIDLGQLFSLIGKGFSSLFGFIGNIIKSIFTSIMVFILFLRRNILKLFVGALIGALLGGYLQYFKTVATYESSMTVQPNYGSSIQLYKNGAFYQNLINQKDFDKLASNFNLSVDEAKSIKSIKVEPYKKESQILLLYNNFVSRLDSSTVNLISFDKFTEIQPVESYKYHVVTVTATDKYVFGKLMEPIIASIVRNPYYDRVKTTSFENLMTRKKVLESSMGELDSLRSLYKNVMIAESMKESGGTNIYMSSTGKENKEVVIFDKYMNMNEALISVNKQLTEENEVVNVVSSFNPVGSKVGGLKRNRVLQGGLLGFILTLIGVNFIGINRKLSEFEKKLKSKEEVV